MSPDAVSTLWRAAVVLDPSSWPRSEVALAGTTWLRRTLVSISLFSGFSRSSTVPAGSFSNASLVGREHRERAFAGERVDQGPRPARGGDQLWTGSVAADAFSAIGLSGNISAPAHGRVLRGRRPRRWLRKVLATSAMDFEDRHG